MRPSMTERTIQQLKDEARIARALSVEAGKKADRIFAKYEFEAGQRDEQRRKAERFEKAAELAETADKIARGVMRIDDLAPMRATVLP